MMAYMRDKKGSAEILQSFFVCQVRYLALQNNRILDLNLSGNIDERPREDTVHTIHRMMNAFLLIGCIVG